MMRPRNAIGGVLAIIVGYLAATHARNFNQLVIPMLIMVLVNGYATVLNDVYDQAVDASNKRQNPLLNGILAPHQAKLFGYGLLMLALVASLLSSNGVASIGFVAAFCLLSYIYNQPPLQTSHRPILSLLTLTVCTGFLPVVYGLALGNNLSPHGIYLAMAWFLFRWGINAMKDFKDVVGDKRHHKHTFLLRYGKNVTLITSALMTTLGFGSLIVYLYPLSSQLSLFLACSATVLIGHRLSLLRFNSNQQIHHGFVQAIIMQHVFDAGFIVWLAIS